MKSSMLLSKSLLVVWNNWFFLRNIWAYYVNDRLPLSVIPSVKHQYNSLSRSLKDDLWLLGAISFTIPYQMIEIWPMTAMGYSFTIPYQNHWNMTPACKWHFLLQFLMGINEIWPMTARDYFLYNSLSNDWNMTYDCYGPFPLPFLI